MAIVNISEAARLTGRNRRTIQRHIESGKLSKTHTDNGLIGVDTSELIRVYGELRNKTKTKDNQVEMSHETAPKSSQKSDNGLELEILKKENELLKELILEKDKRNEDLRHALLLLEDKTEKLPQQNKTRKGVLGRIKDAILDK